MKNFESVNRTWLIISSQPNIHDEMFNHLTDMSLEHPRFLVLSRCSSADLNTKLRCRLGETTTYFYPEVLKVT